MVLLFLREPFEKALKQYKKVLRTQQTEQETLQDTLVQKMPAFAGAAVEGVPFVGPLLREGVKTTAEHLMDRRYNVQKNRDAEILEDPIHELTRVFVDELNRLAESRVLLGSKRVKKRRVILFFDTFEQLADEIILDRDRRPEEIQRWMQRYADRLEHYTRLAPYNWFNFYPFWD